MGTVMCKKKPAPVDEGMAETEAEDDEEAQEKTKPAIKKKKAPVKKKNKSPEEGSIIIMAKLDLQPPPPPPPPTKLLLIRPAPPPPPKLLILVPSQDDGCDTGGNQCGQQGSCVDDCGGYHGNDGCEDFMGACGVKHAPAHFGSATCGGYGGRGAGPGYGQGAPPGNRDRYNPNTTPTSIVVIKNSPRPY